MTLEELKRLHGLFLIDKPAGPSSFGVLEDLKHTMARACNVRVREIPKMGHGGTLDPFATGLLVVCFNEGVKLSRYALDSRKRYAATVQFGQTTASGDHTNDITSRVDKVPASLAEIQAAASGFVGVAYDQTPPMHSAKKVAGKPLYKLAHQGIEVERAPRRCEIFSFTVRDYDPASAVATIECEVSAGTYIRTLAQDLATRLDSLALLTSLRRLGSGKFDVANATPVEEALGLRGFVPVNRALPHLRHVAISTDEARALRMGQQGGLSGILSRELARAGADPDPGTKLAAGGAQTPFADRVALYLGEDLVGISAREEDGSWGIERIFLTSA